MDFGEEDQSVHLSMFPSNPFAPSNTTSSLSTCYKKHENIKKRAYGQCIREVEHASFTPVVMSATGGLAHEATFFTNVWLPCWLTSGVMIIQL